MELDSTTLFVDRFKEEVLYDYIFIGLGASNSLLLLQLLKNPLFAQKKVAVIEPESKNTNDKTYCFWASPDEAIVQDLNAIISHHYNAIVINHSESKCIKKQSYYYVRSIDLYTKMLTVVKEAGVPIFRHEVQHLFTDNNIQRIESDKGIFKTKYIFDSRPPSHNELKPHDIYLNQSFYGLYITCDKAVFDENTFEMMNFNVDQDKYTQFFYVLPFNKHEALIELTRFGSEKIEQNYAKKILEEKIYFDYGKFEITGIETGCIPMTSYVNPPNNNVSILNTGARANLIKPSTGYGFKNMYLFSKLVCEKFQAGTLYDLNTTALKSAKRFRFYDTLLLIILLKWPHQGKKIFTRLFEKQDVFTIFSFLDEKTHWYQELKIFFSLQWFPFIRALIIHLTYTHKKRYLIATFTALLYVILETYSSAVALYFNYSVIGIGLLLVGIPHGAVDHLLQKPKDKNSHSKFVFKYLLIIVLYVILWQFFPVFSIILFMVYASFHFGESELEDAGKKVHSLNAFVQAFILGLSILSFIIFTHFNEAIHIIRHIHGLQFIKAIEHGYKMESICIAGLSLIYIVYQTKSAFSGLIFLLLLGAAMPLLLAFALYFILQHSLNAWQHLKTGLSVNSVVLYIKAFPYLLGAVLIFAALHLKGSALLQDTQFLSSNFFVFLSCISLPHFIIMHVFYKSFKTA